MDRRTLLKLLGMPALPVSLWGCSDDPTPADNPLYLGGVTTSLLDENDYDARIEGTIPSKLSGALYKNGAGLFERGDIRKTCIVDGDGMLNAYFVQNGAVRFKNRYVRTDKWIEEESAGAYLYDTWTTKLPTTGPIPDIRNQAGVSVRRFNGKLYAFDEGSTPYEVSPESLDTIALDDLSLPEGVVLSAHPKLIAETGEWAHFGITFGPTATLNIIRFDASGALTEHQTMPLDPMLYAHDFFATPRYSVIHLQPVRLDLPTLLGGSTIHGSMKFEPERGSRFLVFEKGSTDPPREVTIDPKFMWHTIGAYERGDELVLDWIGHESADSFVGADSQLCAIMRGIENISEDGGKVRRTVIDVTSMSATDELVADIGACDLPTINKMRIGARHRYGYIAYADADRVMFNGVARVDVDTGNAVKFDFGPGAVCSEPMFAPKPGASFDGESDAEPGWVLVEVTYEKTGKGALAILDAEHLEDGPVAFAHLEHHIPLKFHGEWLPS